MPHVTIEYTANLHALDLDRRALLEDLHEQLAALGEGIVRADIKSRFISLEDYLIGDGRTANSFVHARLALLDKRTEDFKAQAAQTVLNVLTRHYVPSGLKMPCELCAEVVDIVPSRYKKQLISHE